MNKQLLKDLVEFVLWIWLGMAVVVIVAAPPVLILLGLAWWMNS